MFIAGKYLNMNKQTKRRLYKCGENFLINEQIPSWIETGRHSKGIVSPNREAKMPVKCVFLFRRFSRI